MPKPRLALDLDEAPESADVETVIAGLRAFNEKRTGRPIRRREFAVFVRDGDGAIAGGLTGVTYWDWMYVDYLWLREDLRGSGWGRRLIEAAERLAVKRGCRGAWLDTFSFQAPGFYERMGYAEFGVLADHPKGESRHFFWKRLPARSREPVGKAKIQRTRANRTATAMPLRSRRRP